MAQGVPAACAGLCRPGGSGPCSAPGLGARASRRLTASEKRLHPADAQPSLLCPAPGAAGTPRQTRVWLSGHPLPELHLGSCPQRCDWQRPSAWRHSEPPGPAHCWKAQSTGPGLGHGCAGDAHEASTEASAPPGQPWPPTPHGGRTTAPCPQGLSPHPRRAGPVVSTPEGITAHGGISRPSLCPSARTPGHLASWSGRLAGETGRSLLELKPAECVVCSPVWLPGGARLGGCGVSRLHRRPVVSWGTGDCPPSQEGPGPLRRLLEGPRGRGALPRTGSRCCAGPEPGSLWGQGAGGCGGGQAAPAVF